jgi:ureidoacrylate peracid hydrolase
MTEPVSYFPSDDPAARYLPARPEPIMIRPAAVVVLATNEELIVARETVSVLTGA